MLVLCNDNCDISRFFLIFLFNVWIFPMSNGKKLNVCTGVIGNTGCLGGNSGFGLEMFN